MAIPGGKPTPTPATAPDPSMEDILASIRRILNEDDSKPPEPAPIEESPVLVLDQSMLVAESEAAERRMPEPEFRPEPPMNPPEPPRYIAPPPEPEPEPVYQPRAEPPPRIDMPAMEDEQALVGPVAADAAASAVGSLMRTLAAERSTAVYRGGPTIEELVREEIRPLLKHWLDTHLPGLVERLVQSEIERVTRRGMS